MRLTHCGARVSAWRAAPMAISLAVLIAGCSFLGGGGSGAASGSGPCRPTTSDSDGPGTYAVASQGGSASRPAATTGAVYMPLTARAAATSRLNRSKNSGSRASSGWMTFTATARPARE